MPGIGIVLNPHSKKHRKDPEKMRQMAFIVGDRGSCKTTDDLPDLRRVAEQFKTRDIDILAIGGGDGTNHVTLTQFIEVYGEKPLPKIALLRGGTMNLLAGCCGVSGTPEKILSNLIYKYHQQEEFETVEMDLTKINDRYGFIFGCGVIFNFMQAYYTGTFRPGPAKAAWTLTRAITAALANSGFAREMFERFDADVWVNGKKWPFANYAAIYSGSIPTLGLGFDVFYHAKEFKKFHAISFSLPPRNVLRHVPFMAMGKPSRCEQMLSESASSMKIELAKEMPYTIDGDMLPPAKSLHLSVGPRLTILVR